MKNHPIMCPHCKGTFANLSGHIQFACPDLVGRSGWTGAKTPDIGAWATDKLVQEIEEFLTEIS